METIIGNSRDYIFENILAKNGICAEIGVFAGINSDRILKLSKPKKLFLIDAWDLLSNYDEEFSKKNYIQVKKKFKTCGNIKIIKEESTIAVKQFKNEFFDWVYIDASHDFKSVKEDIKSWWPKIKLGGFLCGHDYELKNPGIIKVKKTVDEFLKKNNLELYYRGIGDDKINKSAWDGPTDWAILKK